GDYFTAIVLAEEMARCRSGGVGMAISVQAEMATPPILKFGTEAQKQKYLVPAIKGTKIAAMGITVPEGGSYVSNIRTRDDRLHGSAGSIACAEVAVEETLKWCKEREAFGRPIGKFQVNRHKLVDMYTDITVAKNFVYSVAEKWNREEYPVSEISMAKLVVGRVTTQVADTCLQLYGGMGYMAETG